MPLSNRPTARLNVSSFPAVCLPWPSQLALILLRQLTLPEAPAGAQVTWAAPRRGFYSLARSQAASAAQLARSRSGTASLGAGAAGPAGRRRTRSSGGGPAVFLDVVGGRMQQQQWLAEEEQKEEGPAAERERPDGAVDG